MEHRVYIFFALLIAGAAGKIVPILQALEPRNSANQIRSTSKVVTKYVQIAITKNLCFYTPLDLYTKGAEKQSAGSDYPSYLAFEETLGSETVLLREASPNSSWHSEKAKYVSLQRNELKRRHVKGVTSKDSGYFVYDVVKINYRRGNDSEIAGIPFTTVHIVEDNFHDRFKRSNKLEKLRNAARSKDRENKEKRLIHIPTLYIDPEIDGFKHVFYEEMVTAAICLTSQPGLDRHELVDEFEVLLCNNKGYGNLLNANANASASLQRSKREGAGSDDADSREGNTDDDPKWSMNKTMHDTLWKAERNGSTTPHPLGEDAGSDGSVDYDYSADGGGVNETGWENDDIVEDPSALDYMTWPPFLPAGVSDDDEVRKALHLHGENFTLEYFRQNLLMSQEEIAFEKRSFALNESSYLANFYEYFLQLSPYSMKPILANFIDKRSAALNKFKTAKLNSTSLRHLFMLFAVDVHHVNCFNRHLRFYGYIMKRPASINGDTITNDVRLTRGIIMRALELIRHVPQYNVHRALFLRFLIAALKERAAFSKNLTTLIGENDYTELYEVASYLEHLLQNGIHPDEVNQDLFVQETRFYSHHFMNTLTL